MEKATMDKIYTFSDLTCIQSFITHLKRKANRLNICLKIDDSKYIEYAKGIELAGYFEEKDGKKQGILATATGLSIQKWLPILVHESCHMDQWEENINLWKLSNKINPNVVDEWLNGKNFSEKKINAAIDITRELELDCEKRAVEKIKKFKLPIDIGEYIQKANAYIFFHNYMKSTRRWPSKIEDPLNNPKVYKKCSKVWYDSYEELPDNVLSVFKKYKV